MSVHHGKLRGGEKLYEIHEPKLTNQQQKAIFAYCDHVARDMNAAGISMQHVISQAKLEIPPTGKMLYYMMWKPIQTPCCKRLT